MFPEVIAVIPTGRPVIFILVAPPPKVYSIGVIALPLQIDWMSVPVADVKFNVLPLIFIVILSVIENPQIFVAVSVKVIVLPEIAVVGIVYDVFKMLEFEKVPEGADHETLVWPWAVPKRLIVCPAQALTGVVPASTVKGGIGAVQPLFT